MLTFVIPVRHPQNTTVWPQLKARLVQTMAAIARQDHGAWRAVVVANAGADLPPLPDGIAVKRVDFAPNPFQRTIEEDREAYYDAIRYDKGRRILAGMLHDRDTDYYMVVDEDDFVSNRLARFVNQHGGAPGWRFRKSYVWGDGGKWLYRHPAFHKFCGTSHIVRADLMELPDKFEDATVPYIKRRIGSHVFIDDDLQAQGAPLAPLPFCGAVYRIGHAGTTSNSGRLLNTFILRRDFIRRPWGMVNALCRLRPLTPRIRREFFEG